MYSLSIQKQISTYFLAISMVATILGKKYVIVFYISVYMIQFSIIFLYIPIKQQLFDFKIIWYHWSIKVEVQIIKNTSDLSLRAFGYKHSDLK